MDRKVTLNLLKYKKFLIDEGKAPNTINLNFSAINSFYKSFQIILPEIVMDKVILVLKKIKVKD